MTFAKEALLERIPHQTPADGEVSRQTEIGLPLIYLEEHHIVPARGSIQFSRRLLILNASADVIWVKYPPRFYAGQIGRYRSIPPSFSETETGDVVTVTAADGNYQLYFYNRPPMAIFRTKDNLVELVGQVPIRVSGGPGPRKN